MKKLLLMALLVAPAYTSLADSPLTSTPFYKAYLDVPIVKHASEKGMDDETVKYLASQKGDAMHKMAVVNALGWGNTNHVKVFEKHLLKQRKGITEDVFTFLGTASNSTPEETEMTRKLTADDLTVWAYLQTMGDYFKPAMGMRAAFLGWNRNRNSMAHMVPFALISSQKAFDSNWCKVYQIPHTMLEEQTYTDNIINEGGLKIIMDYINLYKGDCKE